MNMHDEHAMLRSAYLWLAINQAHRQIWQKSETALSQAGLPPLRWFDILWTLMAVNRRVRPLELQKLLSFEQSGLSRTLAAMEKAGMVSQTRHQSDGRGKVVDATDLGRTTARAMWRVYGPILKEQIGDPLAGDDIGKIAGAIWKLSETDPPYDLPADTDAGPRDLGGS